MSDVNSELDDGENSKSLSRYIIAFLPLILFGALAVFFFLQLTSGRNNQDLPSALIGQTAPSLDLQALEPSGLPPLNDEIIAGKVTLLNVWASWCGPCRLEHEFLMALKDDPRFMLVGVNYKDKTQNAGAFLAELGNPYDAIGVDPNGQTTIDWGVYGVPETFLVSKTGTILYKHIGPISDNDLKTKIIPKLEQALLD